jgi:hypothetical protein
MVYSLFLVVLTNAYMGKYSLYVRLGSLSWHVIPVKNSFCKKALRGHGLSLKTEKAYAFVSFCG